MKIIFYGDSLTEGKLGVSYINKIKLDFPSYNIINYGKNGDTVISLYERIKTDKLDISSDISFLWIGTNDIFSKISKFYKIFKIFSNQICVDNFSEFIYYYKEILYILSCKAKKVICVPPIFIGENLKNKWNQELKEISVIIKDITNLFDNVMYLDLRKIFESNLENKNPSNYIVKSNIRVFLDFLMYNTSEKIDKKSNDRGLFFTLDGVHLNSRAAGIVSDVFSDKIYEIVS